MKISLQSRPVAEYVIWLAVAIFFYGFSFSFADPAGQEVISPDVWPRFFAAIMAIVATVHLRSELQADHDDSEPESRFSVWATAQLFIAPLVFVFLMPRIGFYVAVPLFLMAQLLLLGERRAGVLLLTTASATAAVLLVFTTVFFVAVPLGTWPSFNAINVAILTSLR